MILSEEYHDCYQYTPCPFPARRGVTMVTLKRQRKFPDRRPGTILVEAKNPVGVSLVETQEAPDRRPGTSLVEAKNPVGVSLVET